MPIRSIVDQLPPLIPLPVFVPMEQQGTDAQIAVDIARESFVSDDRFFNLVAIVYLSRRIHRCQERLIDCIRTDSSIKKGLYVIATVAISAIATKVYLS